MKYINLTICCLLTFFMSAGIANAQNQDNSQRADTTVNPDNIVDTLQSKAGIIRNEIAIGGSVGISVINYSLVEGGSRSDGSSGISGILGLAYTRNFNEHFGIVSGIEMTRYGSKASYDVIEGKREYGNGDDRLEFDYSINGYIEEQSTMMISIPVMAQYSALLSDQATFYLAGGFKFGLPINAKATIFSKKLSTGGFFFTENMRYYEDLPERGFTRLEQPVVNPVDIPMKVSVAASIETGSYFTLIKNVRLYVGVYLDYGLNNIRSIKGDNMLVGYNTLSPSIFTHKSVLNTSLSDNVRILATGLKLKMSFGW